MNIIKIILSILGLIFGVMLALWAIGVVWSLLWYAVVIGLLVAVGYGGYKLFTKAESKLIDGRAPTGLTAMDEFDREMREFDRKYLGK